MGSPSVQCKLTVVHQTSHLLLPPCTHPCCVAPRHSGSQPTCQISEFKHQKVNYSCFTFMLLDIDHPSYNQRKPLWVVQRVKWVKSTICVPLLDSPLRIIRKSCKNNAYVAVERVIIGFSGGPKRIFTSVFIASYLDHTRKGHKGYSQSAGLI